MRNEIVKLFECQINKELYGLTVIEDSPVNVTVYKDKLVNLCGFRQYVPFYFTKEGYHYYEIGYFMELLCKGDKLAFEVLHCDNDYVYHKDILWEHITDNKKDFVSRALVDKLIQNSKTNHKRFKNYSKLASVSTEEVKLVNYDPTIAFEAILDIRLARDLLLYKEFRVRREDFLTLEGVYEGRFKYRTVDLEYRDKLKEVKKIYKKTLVRDEPNTKKLNEILLNIRDGHRTIF